MGWSVAHPTYIFTASHKKSYPPSLPILPNADAVTNKKTDKRTIVVILTLLTTMIFTQKTQAQKVKISHSLFRRRRPPPPPPSAEAEEKHLRTPEFPTFSPSRKKKIKFVERKESLGDPGEVAMSPAASDFSRTDLESPPHVLSLLERRTNCLKLFPSFSYSPSPSFRKRRRRKKS